MALVLLQEVINIFFAFIYLFIYLPINLFVISFSLVTYYTLCNKVSYMLLIAFVLNFCVTFLLFLFMSDDILFSDDVQLLRQEIVRLRTMLDLDYRVNDVYRARCESLNAIVQSLISQNYGKA